MVTEELLNKLRLDEKFREDWFKERGVVLIKEDMKDFQLRLESENQELREKIEEILDKLNPKNKVLAWEYVHQLISNELSLKENRK